MIYVSLGSNCHPAKNLVFLGLRNASFPFDWLYTDPDKGIHYVNDNINHKFEKFMTDLEYGERDKVISKNYPYALFFHQDLIKNVSTNCDDKSNVNIIESLNKRIVRFLDLILDSEAEVIFLYNHRSSPTEEFLESVREFTKNDKIKCKYTLIIYSEENINISIPNVKFIKYINDRKVNKLFGNHLEFKAQVLGL